MGSELKEYRRGHLIVEFRAEGTSEAIFVNCIIQSRADISVLIARLQAFALMLPPPDSDIVKPL